MNRNTELHFSQTPKIDIKRSKFLMENSHKTTWNNGEIIPLFCDADILPGDTVNMNMAEIIRMATPIYPIMDNLYMDIYWFFVPNRLVWEHWKNFWGENDDPWTQTTEYEIPQLESPSGGWTEGTIADYFGIPTKVGNISVNALPFRAYAKIINDWFRDENLKYNCHLYTDDTTRTGQNGTESGYSYVTGTELGGTPCKAAKFHDWFTSALPQPQKGQPVEIKVDGGLYPVTAGATAHTKIGDTVYPVQYYTTSQYIDGETINNKAQGYYNSSYHTSRDGIGLQTAAGSINKMGGTATNVNMFLTDDAGQTAVNQASPITPINLYADINATTVMTINALRTAFAIQKYFENAGLHGTRYIEYLRSVFGVTSSDARMQRAEYLGGKRIPINMEQVLQTSSTDNTSPQGNTSGFSCTIDSSSMFTKSFEEHGTLMCLAVTRTDHTYQQGLAKQWTRKKWTDYYNPFFAHLGEQAILNENIYAQGSTVVDSDGNVIDKQAFGYQEAWSEYRYHNNRTSGYMRSNATGSLDVWHFADDYNSLPYLSADWIDEPKENVDRTIAVSSQITHQFWGDIFFKAYYTRPMPVYSVPGLIDHV